MWVQDRVIEFQMLKPTPIKPLIIGGISVFALLLAVALVRKI